MVLRSMEEKIYLEGQSSKDIVLTLTYMKKNGFDNIKSVKMNGRKRVILTMKEDYFDEDIREILDKMSSVFNCSVLAIWNE